MIPVMQTGRNCMQACLASIFETSLEEVPDLGPSSNQEEWCRRLDEWLGEKSLKRIILPYVMTNIMNFKGMYCVIGVQQGSVCHACVWKDGKIVHDPMPGGTGEGEKVVLDIFVKNED